MNAFDVWAVFITLAALFGCVNYHLLRLPAFSGIFALSLLSSVVILIINYWLPAFHIQTDIENFLKSFNFSTTLLRGMLCFLLFAGAWEVDLEHLRSNGTLVALLAFFGVIISTAVIGVLAYLLFWLLGLGVPIVTCLVFAALISPTDPISVLALLKQLHAPKDLEAQIAGESLFNDGIGVVIFFGLISLAGLNADAGVDHVELNVASLELFFIRQMGGGILLGLTCGFIALRIIRGIEERSLELLITLACAMGAYSLSFWLDVSGPIAVVTGGILLGNHGRSHGLSESSREHISAFWEMVDNIMNSTLFLLLGLELFVIQLSWMSCLAAVCAIPIVLLGRLVSVAIPVLGFSLLGEVRSGLIVILTWGGLRGGLSIAMVLSLPHFADIQLLLSCTYAVVLFSVLVQGITMKPLLNYFDVSAPEKRGQPSIDG